jgi:DNA invertase Pin-like site-specific DNA recombinase
MRDCSAKGRIVISTAKLWKDDVEAIRTLIGQPATKVAAEFGVDRKTIQNIWNDKTWNHTN